MIEGTVAGAIAQIPLIGIIVDPHCDGQILVSNDLLGLNSGYIPSFAKQYAQLGAHVQAAFTDYADEVRKPGFSLISVF